MEVMLLSLGIAIMISMLIAIIFLFKRIIDCFRGSESTKIIKSYDESRKLTFWNTGVAEICSIATMFLFCIVGISFDFNGNKAGEALQIYSNGSFVNSYETLSQANIGAIWFVLLFGIISYYVIIINYDKLSPILYCIFSSGLILNIIFTIMYLFHVKFFVQGEYPINGSAYMIFGGFAYFSILYLLLIIESLRKFINDRKTSNITYKNVFLKFINKLSMSYLTMPILWVISLFPIMIIIQLILILFGQSPDSFIQMFFDTSSYNLSQVPVPEPIQLSGDGHYLCTVSARGHDNIVKPVRAGIRHGNKIVVNRQLLIANAFENILEEYTPKFHKAIRYIYDTYGYPLSKHINTKLSADLVYILMKPLEWVFLFVLYLVDSKPENRINIQYSELRK